MSEEFKKDADESGAEQSNEASPQEIDSNSVEAEFLSLRQQLETKETEAKNYYERLLRQAAELENYKKRSGRERDDAIRYANESLLKDLLPVVDNLERAIAHASGGAMANRSLKASRWCFGVLPMFWQNTGPCLFWPKANRLIRQNTKR